MLLHLCPRSQERDFWSTALQGTESRPCIPFTAVPVLPGSCKSVGGAKDTELLQSEREKMAQGSTEGNRGSPFSFALPVSFLHSFPQQMRSRP